MRRHDKPYLPLLHSLTLLHCQPSGDRELEGRRGECHRQKGHLRELDTARAIQEYHAYASERDWRTEADTLLAKAYNFLDATTEQTSRRLKMFCLLRYEAQPLNRRQLLQNYIYLCLLLEVVPRGQQIEGGWVEQIVPRGQHNEVGWVLIITQLPRGQHIEDDYPNLSQ
jgi:hypothetical protein